MYFKTFNVVTAVPMYKNVGMYVYDAAPRSMRSKNLYAHPHCKQLAVSNS